MRDINDFLDLWYDRHFCLSKTFENNVQQFDRSLEARSHNAICIIRFFVKAISNGLECSALFLSTSGFVSSTQKILEKNFSALIFF